MKNFKAAMAYAKMGWRVFPIFEIGADKKCSCRRSDCKSPGKHPRTRDGHLSATTDEAKIRQWWQRNPFSNIGLATGGASGLVALDIDPRNGGDNSLKELEGEFGRLPHTVTSITGSIGHHFLFKQPRASIGNKVGILPGIDFRGDGGYIVLPPSNHIAGRKYEWKASAHPDECELADLPNWLLELFHSPNKNGTSSKPVATLVSEGQRNSTLFKIAAAMRGRGCSSTEIASELESMNKKMCRPPLDQKELAVIVRNVLRYPKTNVLNITASTSFHWPPRKELPSIRTKVEALTPDMIPEPLQAWVLDTTDRMQNSPEMMMAGVIVSISGLLGRRCGILPKRRDDWLVVPNLWGGIVAPPSWMKSPILREGLLPIYQIENQLRSNFERDSRNSKAEMILKKHQIDTAKKRMKVDLVKGQTDRVRELHSEMMELESTLDTATPILQRVIANDATVEKLCELLNQNPDGLLLFRDELYGFLMNLEKEGREGDRAFFLESWSGDGKFVVDRIARGTIAIHALCLSILGGIQPDRLSGYFASSIRNGSGDDGLLSRFQIMVFPDLPKDWKLIDRKPDESARKQVCELFKRIYESDYRALGFTEGRGEIPATRFNAEAQEVFDSWITSLEQRLRSGSIESPAFEALLGKYRSLMPSLALLFHLVDYVSAEGSSTRISRAAAELASRWCQFLETHAKRIYSGLIRPEIHAAHAIAKKIKAGAIREGMTVRELYRKDWSLLNDPKIVQGGLGLLENLNWIRITEESPTGKGAPSEVIHLHPELRKGAGHE